jgi:pantetheine-phosphate adenylyltransferase
MRIGLYAGLFNVPHNGHLNIIGRSLKLVDHIVVAVRQRPQGSLFEVEERERLLKESIKAALNLSPKQCTVSSFDGMMAVFASELKANVLIRGARNASDFEAESQMAITNKGLAKDLETVLLVSRPELSHLSSSMLLDLIHHDGDIAAYVQKPILTAVALHKKAARAKETQ